MLDSTDIPLEKRQVKQGPAGYPPCPEPFSLPGLSDRNAGLPWEPPKTATIPPSPSLSESVWGGEENTVTPL